MIKCNSNQFSFQTNWDKNIKKLISNNNNNNNNNELQRVYETS
jgi:hypothetical protein